MATDQARFCMVPGFGPIQIDHQMSRFAFAVSLVNAVRYPQTATMERFTLSKALHAPDGNS